MQSNDDKVRENYSKLQSLIGSTEAVVHDKIIPEDEKIPQEEVQLGYPLSKQTNGIQAKLSERNLNIKEVLGKLSHSGRVVLEGFLDYIDKMNPAIEVEVEEALRHQHSLWRSISLMFNTLDDNDFLVVYRTVLLLFNEHKGDVFKEEYIYRYPDKWVMKEEEREGFRKLITLMMITRDPSTRRKDVAEIKGWDYLLSSGLTPEAQRRIRNFYEL